MKQHSNPKQEKGLPPILRSKSRMQLVGDLSVPNNKPNRFSSLGSSSPWFSEKKVVVIQPPRDPSKLKSNADMKQVLQYWSQTGSGQLNVAERAFSTP